MLLQHVLAQSKSWILTHGEYLISLEEESTLQACQDQYLQGFPLPYILGTWPFFGRNFFVTPAVLIPRPETELLIEKALDFAQKIDRPNIVDVGTGSGAIAVSLAAELPHAIITASDISKSALSIAQKNARRHLGQPIHFVQADLLQPLQMQFDLICANLPYIPSQTLGGLPVSRWEPRLALDGGADGLEVVRRLLNQARSRLTPSGMILLEIEATCGKNAINCAQKAFPSAECSLHQDLSGKDRIIEIRLP